MPNLIKESWTVSRQGATLLLQSRAQFIENFCLLFCQKVIWSNIDQKLIHQANMMKIHLAQFMLNSAQQHSGMFQYRKFSSTNMSFLSNMSCLQTTLINSLSKCSNYPLFIFLCPKIESKQNPRYHLDSPRTIQIVSEKFKNLCFLLHRNIFILVFFTT